MSDDERQTLIDQLASDHIPTARTAALTLGKIGGQDVVAPLVHALETHPSLWVRKAAVQALGTCRDPDAIGHLVNALADPDLHALAREGLKAHRVDPDYF